MNPVMFSVLPGGVNIYPIVVCNALKGVYSIYPLLSLEVLGGVIYKPFFGLKSIKATNSPPGAARGDPLQGIKLADSVACVVV